MALLNALSFDIEEYFQVTGFAGAVRPENWDYYESRVERGTREILEILAARGARATFFILGWVARRQPDLARRIADAGHEIASHGYWHQRVSDQTPEDFRADVRAARQVLEDAVGRPVTAYRAPSFSIRPEQSWAFEILVEEGYEFDSSMAAGRRGSCGALGRAGLPMRLETPSGGLWEYPLPTRRFLGRDWPVGGGGYFRCYPYAVTRASLGSLNAQGRPVMVYLHPWEFDPEQPRLNVPRLKAWKHYLNLDRTRPRLERLLADFRLGTMSESLAAYQKDHDRADWPRITLPTTRAAA